LRVRLGAAEPARVHHPEVADREVVADRVVRVEPAQRRRDVPRHAPAGAGVGREPQAAADANHVRVERHDQPGGRHAAPHPQIQRIAPHHPAQEEIQPLAARSRRRARKEIADAGPGRHAAVRGLEVERHRPRRKAVERLAHVVGCPLVSGEKESFNRPGAIQHLAQQPQERDDVGLARPAVHDAGKRRGIAPRIEAPHVGGRLRPDHRKDPLDGLYDARHPAERERRGDEADDLAIVVSAVAPDDLDRIGGGIGDVEAVVEAVQGQFQPANLQSAI